MRALTEGPEPWCAGAVVLAGRGPHLAAESAAGWAVRYRAWDPERGVGVELPPEERVPARLDTPFDLASLTKLFTAIATLQQVERGTLALDTPVAEILTDHPAAAAHGFTVRALLTHTTGLRAELPLYALPDDAARYRALATEEPVAEPGTRRYSDLNPLLLQHLLERLTGQRLDRLVAEGITRPLGMTSTGFGPCPAAAATEDERRPWAKADRGMVRGLVHDENAWALGGVAGHAGLFGTGRDLAVLCRALLGGGAYGTARVLAPEYTALMLDEGLGFEVDKPWYMGGLAGPLCAGHTGFTGTSLVVDRATDTFLVLLATTVHPRRRTPDSTPRARAATRLKRAVRDTGRTLPYEDPEPPHREPAPDTAGTAQDFPGTP
ncbi:serine hydrolase domain-containing protein [Streptomyces sp. NPDC004959]|uniref:serine hydrolase domain-containing protein n=1 Tax=Streptomyces sp. NPDC004959 TaxID=3154673 RepID=UPI0033A786E0